MKRLLAFLTGYALLGQPAHAAAQGGAVRGPEVHQLFASVMRAPPLPGVPVTGEANKALLKTYCEKIMKDGQRIYYLNNRSGKMKLQVRGIYAHGATIFFALRLINHSTLDYDVDSIRFFIVQKKGGKQPPLRVNQLVPVYVYDSLSLVKGYGRVTSVFVLPRLTLARGRRLQIEVLEKNGGRHLQVETTNFTLENARLI
jgi:hypothetical protein